MVLDHDSINKRLGDFSKFEKYIVEYIEREK